MNRRRGSAMIESALATTAFVLLIAGIMEFGFIGFASSSVAFAAHRAARFAAVRGSASGRAASISDIQAEALANITALDTQAITVNVSWSPDNNPGGTVRVTVSYSFTPSLLPVSSTAMPLQCTARAIVAQ
jgi:Flp pilus assembly protein TadG